MKFVALFMVLMLCVEYGRIIRSMKAYRTRSAEKRMRR